MAATSHESLNNSRVFGTLAEMNKTQCRRTYEAKIMSDGNEAPSVDLLATATVAGTDSSWTVRNSVYSIHAVTHASQGDWANYRYL